MLEFPQPLGNIINSHCKQSRCCKKRANRIHKSFTPQWAFKVLFNPTSQVRNLTGSHAAVREVVAGEDLILVHLCEHPGLPQVRDQDAWSHPQEIRCRLSLISSHSSSSPISFRSGPSGTHSPAIWSVLWVRLPERYLPAAEDTAGMKTHLQLQRHLSHTCSWKKTDK